MEQYDLEALLRDFDSGEASGLNVVHEINLDDIEMTEKDFTALLILAAATLTGEQDKDIKHLVWFDGAVCRFAFVEGEYTE